MPVFDESDLLQVRIREKARSGLESVYQTDSAVLGKLLPSIRECILNAIVGAFADHIGQVCSGATHNASNIFSSSSNNLFRFVIAPNIRYPEELVVTFYPVAQQKHGVREVRRKLKTLQGGYSHLILVSSSDLTLDADFALLICESVISTVYEWTYDRMFAIRRAKNDAITERLYARLRELFPELAELQKLWLGFVLKGRCYYLIDSRRRDSLLKSMTKMGRKLGAEPLSLAGEIAGMDLPFTQSASNEAFSENKPIKVNIGRLPYSATAPDLATSEQIIYDTDEITVIPIGKVERAETFLVAFCPSTDADFWLKMLDVQRHDLTKILAEEVSSLTKIARACKHFISYCDTSPRVVGDTFGHFFATLYERLTG